MPKIVGLDIPPGLITQYQSVLTLAFYNANPTIKKRKYPVSYAQRISFSNGSLFVKWQNLWGSFLAPRKLSWTDYWETLPFGTHSGTNGWPGSGYSAFIYVNAPRYMAGLELLLDPPYTWGSELCPDPNFEHPELWNYFYNMTISDGKMIVPSVGNWYVGWARIPLGVQLESGFLKVEVTVKIPDGLEGFIAAYESEEGDFYLSAGWATDGSNVMGGVYSYGTGGEYLTLAQIYPYTSEFEDDLFEIDVDCFGTDVPIEIINCSLKHAL